MPNTRKQTTLNLQLIDAAAAGRTAEFAGLLKHGADLDAVEHGSTALIAAIVHHQFEAVGMLIDLGAKVHLPDQQRKTPLSHALGQKSTDIARLLVQAGADLHIRNHIGDNLLTAAVKGRHPTMVETLIELDVDVNLPNRLGKSALSLALHDMDMVRSLLDAKADLGHRANKDVLLDAIGRKLTGTAQLLLCAGATPNAVDWDGKAALTHAVDQEDAGLVRSLIAAKADPNQGANQQALAHALPKPEMLQALLDAGARPDVADPVGQGVMEQVFQRGIAQAATQWIPADSAPQAGACKYEVWNPMTLAVQVGTVEIIGIVREAGYSVEVADASGHSLLMLACNRRTTAVVDALLGKHNGYPGANPDASAHSDGRTPLMAAAAAGNPTTVKLLLAAGANPNAADTQAHTAMDYVNHCADLQRKNAVQELLEEAINAPAWQAWKSRMDEIDEDPEPAMGDSDESWLATINDLDDCRPHAEGAEDDTCPAAGSLHLSSEPWALEFF